MRVPELIHDTPIAQLQPIGVEFAHSQSDTFVWITYGYQI